MFIGNLLAALCFGIMTIQTSTYYRSFPNDGRLVKLAVCFSWILGAFQLACVTRSLYWWLVTNSNNPLALGKVPWEFAVYQINAVCASACASPCVTSIWIGCRSLCCTGHESRFSRVDRKYTWLIVTWLTSQAIADVVIAACMSVLLRRRRTGSQKWVS
ncbi:hypothetical protein BS47DRAFT_1203089 [Hydnum rufescens UP504]|uniref:Uncharacterized protein n=1 Tax=Hydnum rufescens UP504 TaxID=1448309 RepID=A0A9P6ASV9_9AGAM|nr:hypothetical protein BS47DRAFT_1203089 [Hydnum rufescens UP504]